MFLFFKAILTFFSILLLLTKVLMNTQLENKYTQEILKNHTNDTSTRLLKNKDESRQELY